MTPVKIVSRISPDHGRKRDQGRSPFRLNGPDPVFLASGWPDLNRRPLDPQVVGSEIDAGQTRFRTRVLSVLAWAVFAVAQVVWSPTGPPAAQDRAHRTESATSSVSTRLGSRRHVEVWLYKLVIALACVGLAMFRSMRIRRSSPSFLPTHGSGPNPRLVLASRRAGFARPGHACPVQVERPTDVRPGPGRRGLVAFGARRVTMRRRPGIPECPARPEVGERSFLGPNRPGPAGEATFFLIGAATLRCVSASPGYLLVNLLCVVVVAVAVYWIVRLAVRHEMRSTKRNDS